MTDDRYITGMKDVQGSWTFNANDYDDPIFVDGESVREMFICGPRPMPRWKHWFYIAMEKLRGWPYPEIVIAGGPAVFHLDETTTSDDGVTTITGTFSGNGIWRIK